MNKKLLEMVDVKKLTAENPQIFDIGSYYFDLIIKNYKFILFSKSKLSPNKSIEELLEERVLLWSVLFKSSQSGSIASDETEIIINLIRCLVASVVLGISEFSKVILKQCCRYASVKDIKEVLIIILKNNASMKVLEENRQKFGAELSKELTKSDEIITQNVSQNSNAISTQQNTPKYWVATKSPEGWRRAIYLDKKNTNGEYTVKIGGAEYMSKFGYDAIPLFDSTKQATDFIENIKLGKSSTRRKANYVSNFIFMIADITNKKINKSLYLQNLSDYELVITECGEAYINKNASCF